MVPREAKNCSLESNKAERIELNQVQIERDLPFQYKNRLLNILNDYRNVIATKMSELGRTQWTEFEIEEVPDSRPVRSKPFRLSKSEKEALKDILNQMKDAGMIENSHSAYASPVMFVKKTDRSWRMVID